MNDRDLTDFERKIIGNVSEHGWHGMHVFDPDGVSPSFTYSVGFPHSLGAPEFIVFGLDRQLMHQMLWEIFKQIQKGEKAEDWMRWTDILVGHNCISRTAEHESLFTEYMRSSRWFWRYSGGAGFPPAMQLVWPGSRDGLFPWDAGCSLNVIEAQPALWAKPGS